MDPNPVNPNGVRRIVNTVLVKFIGLTMINVTLIDNIKRETKKL